MLQQTQLYNQHLKAGAKMVEFGGWEMPIHYGSQIQEHHAVRQDAGMFDVSHMTVVDVVDPEGRNFLRYLLANNIDKLSERGKALYTCMLNDKGGIIDDLICYWLGEDKFRLVVNAATRNKDLSWMNQQAKKFKVRVAERVDLGMLAIQGPKAILKANVLFSKEIYSQVQALKPFSALLYKEWLIARTGYTGEDGIEIILPNQEIEEVWEKLLAAKIVPCGLGARDTLRLEAGLNLYGVDMDETITPYEANLGWTVALEPADRDFIGRAALMHQHAKGIQKKLVGLILEEKGVLRGHQKILANGAGAGEITSGTFSPTLGVSI